MSHGEPDPPAEAASSPQPVAGVTDRPWQAPTVEELRQRIPGHEILELIGQGGMGAVYLGTQLSLSRRVAVKILPPRSGDREAEFVARFRNEAELMASVSHPNIVTVHDFGQTDDGLLYLVMEYVEGESVLDRLLKSPWRRLASNEARFIAVEVCRALSCAHEAGLVHRDIKPGNVLLQTGGGVKVADFGLARWLAPNMGASLTMTGAAVGTPGYIPPEALVAEGRIDERADVYAVGAMLFQMLTGHPPQGWIQGPSGEAPGVNPGFDRIVQRAMAREPEARFESAAAFREALESIPVESPPEVDVLAPTTHLPRSGGSDSRTAGWLWIWVVLVAIALGWWAWSHQNREVGPPEPSDVDADAPSSTLTAPSRRVEADEGAPPPLATPPRRVEE